MLKKSDEIITILCVNYNTSDFIEVMLEAFEKLTASSYKVIIVDNGSNKRHLKQLVKVAQQHKNLQIIFRKQSVPGSIGHGEAMDLMVNLVDTPYFVTMDADASFLTKNWDLKLMDRLNETTKVIGTQAPGQKPKDFPLMFSVLYESDAFVRSGASFLPNIKENKLLDTGWEVREKFHNAGFHGEVLKFENTRVYRHGPYSRITAAEFYMDGDPNIFASHFGRGSSGGLSKIKTWWRPIPVIGSIVARIIAFWERRTWIQITKQIVTSSEKSQ